MSKPEKKVLTEAELNDLPLASRLLLDNEFEMKYIQYQLRLEESSRNAEADPSIEEVGMAAPSAILGGRAWIEAYLDLSDGNISPNDTIKISQQDEDSLKYISDQFEKNVQFITTARDIKKKGGKDDVKNFSNQVIADMKKNGKAFVFIRSDKGEHTYLVEYQQVRQKNGKYKYYKKIYDASSGPSMNQQKHLGSEYVKNIYGHIKPSITYEMDKKDYEQIIYKDIENSTMSLQYGISTVKEEKENAEKLKFVTASPQTAFVLRYGSCAASNFLKMISENVDAKTFHALYEFISRTQYSDLKKAKGLENIDTTHSELNFLNYVDNPKNAVDKYAFQGLTLLTKNRVIFEGEPNSIKQITKLLENKNASNAFIKNKIKSQFGMQFTDAEVVNFRKNTVEKINKLYTQIFKSAVNDEDIVITSDMLPNVNKCFLQVLNKNGGILTDKNFETVLNDCRNKITSEDSKIDLNIQASVKKDIINEQKMQQTNTLHKKQPLANRGKGGRLRGYKNLPRTTMEVPEIPEIDTSNLSAYERQKLLNKKRFFNEEKNKTTQLRDEMEKQLELESKYRELEGVSFKDRAQRKARLVYTDVTTAASKETAKLFATKLSARQNHYLPEHNAYIDLLYKQMFETAINDPDIILTPSMIKQTTEPLLRTIDKHGGTVTSRNINHILDDWREEVKYNTNVDFNIRASVTKDMIDKQPGSIKNKNKSSAYNIYQEMTKEKDNVDDRKINLIEPGMRFGDVIRNFTKNNVKLEPRNKPTSTQIQELGLKNKPKKRKLQNTQEVSEKGMEYIKVKDKTGEIHWKLKSPSTAEISGTLSSDASNISSISVPKLLSKTTIASRTRSKQNHNIEPIEISRDEDMPSVETDTPSIKIPRLSKDLIQKASNYKKIFNRPTAQSNTLPEAKAHIEPGPLKPNLGATEISKDEDIPLVETDTPSIGVPKLLSKTTIASRTRSKQNHNIEPIEISRDEDMPSVETDTPSIKIPRLSKDLIQKASNYKKFISHSNISKATTTSTENKNRSYSLRSSKRLRK